VGWRALPTCVVGVVGAILWPTALSMTAIYKSDEMIEYNGMVRPVEADLQATCSFADFPLTDPNRPDDYFSKPPEDNLTLLCIVGIKAS